jgi:REP element-mobilizing transposase RayT
MNRGADRERIFFTKSDGRAFERLLAEGGESDGVEVHAYCLMPNHYHLLLHCPNGGLSRYMHRVGSQYSRRIKSRLGGDGPLFRSRFRSILVDTPHYLAQVGRYIHRNPIELSPEVDILSYRWSSLRHYAGTPPPHHGSAPPRSLTCAAATTWTSSSTTAQLDEIAPVPGTRCRPDGTRRYAGCLAPFGPARAV